MMTHHSHLYWSSSFPSSFLCLLLPSQKAWSARRRKGWPDKGAVQPSVKVAPAPCFSTWFFLLISYHSLLTSLHCSSAALPLGILILVFCVSWDLFQVLNLLQSYSCPFCLCDVSIPVQLAIFFFLAEARLQTTWQLCSLSH